MCSTKPFALIIGHSEPALTSGHHPSLDAHYYYSVVDEPQPTELINIWFHLGNYFCRKIGLIHR